MLLPKRGKRKGRRKDGPGGYGPLVAECDRVFSRVVRLSEAGPDGRVVCFTCGTRHPWNGLDCGHYVRRGHFSTRWDRRNVAPQCTTCNRTYGGVPATFAAKIDRRYGAGTAAALRQTAHENAGNRHTRNQLELKLTRLRRELRELMARRGVLVG